MKPTRQPRDVAAARSEGTRGPRSWIARTKPDLSIRFFSSATDAARARRPTDVVLFVLSVAGLALVSLFAPDRTAIDETTRGSSRTSPACSGGSGRSRTTCCSCGRWCS